MRKVSHLPPAKIVSVLTNAAPALVSFAPLHRTVAAPPPPASSACISASACLLAGISWATSAEDNASRVTPLARSITAGGRSWYLRLATNAANSRLSDMAVSLSQEIEFYGQGYNAISATLSLRRPLPIAPADPAVLTGPDAVASKVDMNDGGRSSVAPIL